MNSLIKFVTAVGRISARLGKNRDSTPLWKQMKLPEYHGDFRPDLLQDIDFFNHAHVPLYRKWNDMYRVRMATRKLDIEESTKYFPSIHQIVENNAKRNMKESTLDMSAVRISEIRPYLSDILADLSFNIYLKESRYRYQEEQKARYFNSVKKFECSSYFRQNKTVDQFVRDYNSFINHEIKKSHCFMSPKIEVNYRRNYHDGEVSKVTSAVYYLYFKTDKVKRFFGKLLLAAHRNPLSEKQSQSI